MLTSLWDYLTNFRVQHAELGREMVKVRLLNQLIFLAFAVSSILVPVYIVFFDGYTIIFATLGNVLIELITIFFMYHRKYSAAKLVVTFVYPTVVSTHILILNKGFGEANIFTTIAFATFILYEGNRKEQVLRVAYVCGLFIAAKFYSAQLRQLPSVQFNPYDEILTFPVTITALGLIIFLYQSSLKEYETQKNQLLLDLEHKNAELHVINEELEQFTYIASHDLKTPLRTISSHLDLLRLHLKRNNLQAVEEDLAFAKNGATQLYQLISDILEYKEVTSENAKTETFDLNEVLAMVLQHLDVTIAAKNAQISCPTLPRVTARKHHFQVLFQNLIENGIKYNESETPTVQIRASIDGDYLTLWFKDNGIGIEPIYHEKIFQFFKRLHTNEVYQGSGIGLGLCQKIARYYDGDISVQSDPNLQDGTTFKVKLLCLPT